MSELTSYPTPIEPDNPNKIGLGKRALLAVGLAGSALGVGMAVTHDSSERANTLNTPSVSAENQNDTLGSEPSESVVSVTIPSTESSQTTDLQPATDGSHRDSEVTPPTYPGEPYPIIDDSHRDDPAPNENEPYPIVDDSQRDNEPTTSTTEPYPMVDDSNRG
jgi:hypothetical protein